MSELSWPFVVSSIPHRAFGKLVKMQLADDIILRLTQPEASSLSFALVALRDGLSPEHEIYMSPIASDVAFVGIVRDAGMSIAVPDDALELDWTGSGHWQNHWRQRPI